MNSNSNNTTAFSKTDFAPLVISDNFQSSFYKLLNEILDITLNVEPGHDKPYKALSNIRTLIYNFKG